MSAEQSSGVGEDTARTAQVDITQARMTTKQVAALLAISPRTVAAYAARGQMPAPSACPCCGHSPTWDRAELVAWDRGRPSSRRLYAATSDADVLDEIGMSEAAEDMRESGMGDF